MAVFRNAFRDVTDERFRAAVVLGVASIPFTAGVNWVLTPDPVEGTPLLIACVLSGYLHDSRSVDSARAGALTGFVGSPPVVVWQTWRAFVEWWDNPLLVGIVGDSVLMTVVSVGVTLLAAVAMPVVMLAAGWLGGTVGGWIHERIGSTRLFGSET